MRRTVAVMLVLGFASLAVAESRIVDLPIVKGELPKDKRVVQVRQGDDVTLRWTTDKALEVHLHGYDIEVKLWPGAPAPMRFTARATGRFALEMHGLGPSMESTLGYLEVHPR